MPKYIFVVHSGLLKLMKSVNDLEKTAQEIYNNSVKFLQVTIGGKSLSPLQTMPLPITTVVCPPGSVKLDIFCGNVLITANSYGP